MKKLIFIFGLFICLIASAETYYVKTGGNDASAGTTDGTAWAHCPGMVGWTGSVTLSPGDSVCFNRGNTFTSADPLAAFLTISASGTSGNYIVFTSYGTGVKPILNISADKSFAVIKALGRSYLIFDNLEISHFESTRDALSNQYGIYFGKDASLNVPHNIVVKNCIIHNIPNMGIYGCDDSYRITIGDSTKTTCATISEYSNLIYDCGYAGILLCGRNPSTNLSNWKIYYNYIHDIDFSGGLARDAYGIAITSNEQGTGQGDSDGWPSYCYVRYNHVEDVPGHTVIDCHGGTYIYIQDNYVYNGLVGIGTYAVDKVGYAAAVLNYCYIDDNTVENPGNNALGNCTFIIPCGENSELRATNCYIRDNIIFYTDRPANEDGAYGISFYNIDGLTISGNKVYNGPAAVASGGIGFYSDGNRKVKNITIENNFIYNWYKGILFYSNGIDGDMSINNNIVYSHNICFRVNGGTLVSGCDMVLYNNTIMCYPSATYPYGFDFAGGGALTIDAGASIIIKNNIVSYPSAAAAGQYVRAPTTINGAFTCDYNLYWNSSSANQFLNAASGCNWAAWQALGYDAHSPNVAHGDADYDPLFRNFTGRYSDDNDFDIKPFSPAKDAGVDVELTGDYFNLKYGGRPSIGAIDYHKRIFGIK